MDAGEIKVTPVVDWVALASEMHAAADAIAAQAVRTPRQDLRAELREAHRRLANQATCIRELQADLVTWKHAATSALALVDFTSENLDDRAGQIRASLPS